MKNGLLSLTLTNSLSNDISQMESPILKGAALLYERIVCFAHIGLVKSLVEEVSIGLTTKERQAVRDCFVSTENIYKSLLPFHKSDVLKELDRLPDIRPGVNLASLKQLMEWYNLTQSNLVVNLFLALKLRIPFHAVPQEAEIMASLFEYFNNGDVSEQRPINLSLPNIADLSWNDIFELRKSPYLPQYRDFLSGYNLHPEADIAIVEEINETLWDLIGQLKPSKSGSFIKRLVANIPIPVIPIPNPYAGYKDYKEGSKERQMFMNYGWLWFIQEARAKKA
jgi:hypothetical protein